MGMLAYSRRRHHSDVGSVVATWCGVITVHFDVGSAVPDAVVLVV